MGVMNWHGTYEEYQEWKKNHPACVHCGTVNNVEAVPVGHQAKMTALCVKCNNRLKEDTRLSHESWEHGYKAGFETAQNRPWWKRLFQ